MKLSRSLILLSRGLNCYAVVLGCVFTTALQPHGEAGTITTIAGEGVRDGWQGTNAVALEPGQVTSDAAGNIYFVDSGFQRIRKVDPSGVLTTVAGNGYYAWTPDGSVAAESPVDWPYGLAVSASGTLLFTEGGSLEKIREIDHDGKLQTIFLTWEDPGGMTTDAAGNIYVCLFRENQVLKISQDGSTSSVVAGNGTGGYGGDGGAATNAMLYWPKDVAVDSAGNLYIADHYNYRVRRVTPAGTISTLAGNGVLGYSGDGGAATDASMYACYGVTVDSVGRVYIAEGERVRVVGTDGIINTAAGSSSAGYNGDGIAATNALLWNTYDVVATSTGELLISDKQNRRIRKVNTSGIISTIVGQDGVGDGGPATNAILVGVHGIASDSGGNIYVGDSDDHRVRRIAADGTISTFAGTGAYGYSGDGGPATSATFKGPRGVAVDAFDNVYVADSGNRRVRKIGSDGTISTMAGTGGYGSAGDGGPATSATFKGPRGVFVHTDGTIYITDLSGNCVRKIDTDGTIWTVAGTGTAGYGGDGGPATNATLRAPQNVVVDALGRMFIASDHSIRMVDTNGIITTVYGTGVGGYSGDGGQASAARLNTPLDVGLDGNGNVYIADNYNHRIRMVDPSGVIRTVAGGGVESPGDGGPATDVRLDLPAGIDVSPSGVLCFAEYGGRRVRMVVPTLNEPPHAPTNTAPVHAAADVSLSPTLKSSAFSDPDSGDTHAASQWQVTTSSGNYGIPVYDSGVTTDKTSHLVPAGNLSDATPYYWRCRHQDSQANWSDWSSETSFTTANNPPDQPTNTWPPDQTSGFTLTPTLRSSTFSDADAGDTHGASQWQITATAGNYGAAVFDSGTDATNKTSIAVPEGSLAGHTTYHWRCRHRDNHGAWSAWSSETSFMTANSMPSTPANTSPGDGATGVPLAPTLSSSAFSDDDGDGHQASQWQITTASGNYGAPVHDSGTDTGNKTSLSVPGGTLVGNRTYYWHCRHQDDEGDWSAWSAETSFTTGNTTPGRPSNTFPGNGVTGVALMPTLSSSTFSDPDPGDSHTASQWQVTTSAGNYGAPVFDSGTDAANKSSIAVPGGSLAGHTTYHWHVRHQDNHGAWSAWSGETSFTTVNRAPDTPANASPGNGATEVALTPTLSSSPFSDGDGDGHQASQWQITTAPGSYGTPVYDSGTDTGNKTSLNVPGGTLVGNRTYYWHCRHQDDQGDWSAWSSETSFTTENTIPDRPSNTSPGNGATGVALTPTLSSSVFSDPDPDDSHAASQWQVTTSAGNYGAPVYDSGTDAENKTSLAVPGGTLLAGVQYFWHVRHQDSHGAWSSWSADTSFTTLNNAPNQPSNTSPANGATGVALTPVLSSSAFSDPDTADTHVASHWQITTTAGNYGVPTYDTGTDTGNKTSMSVPGDTLDSSTVYHWRCRHQDNHGTWSDWSSETSFTTLNNDPNAPTNTLPAHGAVDVALAPTLQSSAFSDADAGDTHAASQWQITTAAGNYSSPAFDSGADAVNTTFLTVPEGNLAGNTAYHWRCRHQDSQGAWSPWSAETSFATANSAPDKPSNTVPSNDAVDVALAPTLQSSAFSDDDAADTHQASQWQVTTMAGDYGSPVFDSGTDTGNKTALGVPGGTLGGNTGYHWHVRHQDNHGAWSPWSDETSFTTMNHVPVQPTNVSPSAAATDVSRTPTLVSSAFADDDAGDTHQASQWQIAETAGGYGSPVYDSGTTADKISHSVPGGNLAAGTTYHWHCRHQDNHGAWSPWAAETSFTTANQAPAQPTATSPANGAADVSITPELAAGAFSDGDAGDTHTASQWQITTNGGDYASPVFDSGTDSVNKAALVVPGDVLTGNTLYAWRVRHRDNHGAWSEWSVEASFTTAGRPPDTPSNILPPSDARDVVLTPTLESSPFSDPDAGDTHAASQWQISRYYNNYTAPIFDSGTNATALTSIAVPDGTLVANTFYYWRVRHQDNYDDWSEWSSEKRFKTLNNLPAKPVNTAPIDAMGDVTLPVTLTSSPFTDPDPADTHYASEWEITLTPGDYSSPAYGSGEVRDYKTELAVATTTLLGHRTYYWRVRHEDSSSGWSEWSDETSFTTVNTPPYGPDCVLPAHAAKQVSFAPTLTCTAFNDRDGDVHQASQWQLATAPDFLAPVHDSGTQTDQKTSYAVPDGTLAPSTWYFWRVRHQDDQGDWSVWSQNGIFETRNDPPNRPVNVAPTNGALDVALAPTLESGPFSDPNPGDTHVASEWQIAQSPDAFETNWVYRSGLTLDDKRAHLVPSGTLLGNQTYYWHVRHIDDEGSWSPWSEETAFTTENVAPYSPSLRYPGNGDTGVALAPTLTIAGFFDPDPGAVHQRSHWQLIPAGGSFSSPLIDAETPPGTTNLIITAGTFAPHTTYRWRVRVQDSHDAWSSWSATYSFTTLNHLPDQPTNTNPANGASGLTTIPQLSCGPFVDADPGDAHQVSQWQVRHSTGDYSAPTYDSGPRSDALLTLTVPAARLLGNRTYFWRVRHQDTYDDWSDWSAETFFSTANRAPSQPRNRAPGNGVAGVSLTPSLQSYAFSDEDVGDIHAASQWQLTTSAGQYAAPLYDSGATTSGMTFQEVPAGRLTGRTTYYWRCRHQDGNGEWSPWSQETHFTTRGAAPAQPTHLSPVDGATDVGLDEPLTSSPFSDPDPGDSHQASQWVVTRYPGNYASAAFSSGVDAVNKTSITVPMGRLAPATTYYWITRHQDSLGEWSPWSVETSFTTGNTAPSRPINQAPANGAADIAVTPVLTTSPFSDVDPGDGHDATHWQVRLSTGTYSAPAFERAAGTDLTSVRLTAGALTNGITAYWRARYRDDGGKWSDWSAETHFSTRPADAGAPATASVTAPEEGVVYGPNGLPASFTGHVADDPAGEGLSENSTSVQLRRSSDNRYWNGAAWLSPAAWLSTTHAETTDGATVAWRLTPPPAPWSHGHYGVTARAADRRGNLTTGTTVSFDVDATGPTVLGVTPAHDTVSVSAHATVTATLSEDIDAATLSGATFTLTPNAPGAVVYDPATRKATLTPAAPLQYETVYTVTLATDVADVYGNDMDEPYVWLFATGEAPDTTPPSVAIVTEPTDNARFRPENVPAAIRGDAGDDAEGDGIAADSTSFSLCRIEAGSSEYWNGAAWTSTLTWLPTTHPAGSGSETVAWANDCPLPTWTTASYGLQVRAIDVVSNAVIAAETLFVVDTTPPTVAATTPALNAGNVATTSVVTVRFNEPMTESSVNGATLVGVIGAITYDAGAHTATLTPASPLQPGRSYTLTITTGVKDEAGNAMASDYNWTFTTEPPPDRTPPVLVDTTPVNGEGDVPVSTTVTAIFNEPMDGTTLTTHSFTVGGVTGLVTYRTGYRQATFAPSEPLAYETTYTATVGVAATDTHGNPLAEAYAWTFTTESPDTTPPFVTEAVPINGERGVPSDAVIRVIFSEPMNGASLNASTFQIDKGVTGVVTYEGSMRRATLTPSVALSKGVTYTATISAGARDLAGNGLATDFSWQFTTEPPDVVPPTIVSSNPGHGASHVPLDTMMRVSFSEQMAAGTINAATFTLDGGVIGSVSYDGNGHSAYFTPDAPLPRGTTITATLSTDVKDLAGNALSGARSWSFTTIPVDITPPNLIDTTPDDNATHVPINGWVIAQFDDDMDLSTFTAASLFVSPSVQGTVSSHGTRAVRFVPAGNFDYATLYTATLTTAIRDAAGNALEAGYTWSFTTESDQPPTLVDTEPENRAVDVPVDSVVMARFSEALDPTSVTEATFLVEGTHGSVHYDPTNFVAIFAPTGNLAHASLYDARVTTGVRDLNGNAMEEEFAWQFTTEPLDLMPPGIVETTPGNGDGGVSLDTHVTAVFTEDLDPATINAASFSLNRGTVASVTYDEHSRTAILQPVGDLYAGVVYTATLSTNVTDDSGNRLASSYTWQFTTRSPDIDGPAIVSTDPVSGSNGVPLTALIRATFDESIDMATVDNSSFTLDHGTLGTFVHASDAHTVTLIPSGGLVAGKTYTAALTSDITDLAGNPLTTPMTWQFTTVPPDLDPPQVVAVAPSNTAVEVERHRDLRVEFNEPMDRDSLTAATVTLEPPTACLFAYVSDEQELRISPIGDLPGDTLFTATVTTGVTDLAGNPLAAPYVWRFRTEPADLTPPTVVGVTPTAGGTGIGVNATVTVEFDEDMDPESLNAGTFTLDNGAIGTVSHGAQSATFRPASPLSYSTTYTATVGTGARDASGNALTAPYSWSFTTQSDDFTPPLVESTSPSNGAERVVVDADVTVTFNETMKAVTIDESTFSIDGVVGTVTYSASSRTARFRLSGDFDDDTLYTARVSTDVEDEAGNAMASEYVWHFRTAINDTNPPLIAAVSPPDSAFDVPVDSPISVTFSEDVDASTLDTNSLYLSHTRGVVTYDADSRTATFTPSTNLLYSSLYTVVLSNSVTDLAGNPLPSNVLWRFTTEVALYDPITIVGSEPAAGSEDASPAGAISVTFNKPLDTTTVTSAAFRLTADGSNVVGDVSYDGTNATFVPVLPLDFEADCVVTLTTNLLDPDGLSMVSNYVFGFRTTTHPVAAVAPVDGETGVAVSLETLEITFSRRMNAASVTNAGAFTLISGNGAVAGSVLYGNSIEPASNGYAVVSGVRFKPDAPLSHGTAYQATLRADVEDEDGVPLVTNYVWSFTTENTPLTWHTELADVGYAGKNPQLARASDGTPHIVYYASLPRHGLRHVWRSGGVWRGEFVDEGYGVGVESAVAVDSQDHVHVAYCGEGAVLTYVVKGGGGWVSDDNIPSIRCQALDLAVDDSGRPYLAYLAERALYCMRKETTWLRYPVVQAHEYYWYAGDENTPSYNGETYVTDGPSLGLLPGGWPIVSYQRREGMQYATFATHLDVARWDGDRATWWSSTWDAGPWNPEYDPSGEFSSLATHGAAVAVAHVDQLDLSCVVQVGASEQDSTVARRTSGTRSSLAYDSEGRLRIAYANTRTDSLVYGKPGDALLWTAETVDTNGVDNAASLALNALDEPGIAYTRNGELAYAYAAQPGQHDGFAVAPVPSPQQLGEAFTLRVAAKDEYGNTYGAYDGEISLEDTTGTIAPESVTLTNGVGTVEVTISDAATDVIITASGDGMTADSNPFDVTAEGIDFLQILPIPLAQYVGEPFGLTVVARKGTGELQTNFNGFVDLLDRTGSLSPSQIFLVDGTGTTSVTISEPDYEAVVFASDGEMLGLSEEFLVFEPPVLDHFRIAEIPSPQKTTRPFDVTVTAVDVVGRTMKSFDGRVLLAERTGTMSPTGVVLHHGTGTVEVAIQEEALELEILATARGVVTTGNTFDVEMNLLPVYAVQDPRDRETVEVRYELPEDAVDVSVAFSTNRGETYDITPIGTNLWWAAGADVGAGKRAMFWRAINRFSEDFFTVNAQAQVVADFGTHSVTGESNTFSLDLYGLKGWIKVVGSVSDILTQKTLEGVSVQLGSNTAVSAEYGIFEFPAVRLKDGNVMTFTHPEYHTNTATVAAPAGAVQIVDDVELIPLVPTDTPVLTNLTARVRDGVFLRGVYVENKVKVDVDWRDSNPVSLDFYADNERVASFIGGKDTYEYTYDMGSEFSPELIGSSYKNRIKVIAVATTKESDPVFIPLRIFDLSDVLPVRLLSLLTYLPGTNDPSYQLSFSFPDSDTMPKGVEHLPVIGDVGFDFTMSGGGKFAFRSGDWELFLGAEYGGADEPEGGAKIPSGRPPRNPLFFLGDYDAAIGVKAIADGKDIYARGMNLDAIKAEMYLKVDKEIGEFKFTDYTPYAALGRIGDALAYGGVNINSIQTIVLKAGGEIKLSPEVSVSPKGLAYNNTQLGAALSLTASYEPSFRLASLSVNATGKVGVDVQISPKFEFKGVTGEAIGSVVVVVLGLSPVDAEFGLLKYTWMPKKGDKKSTVSVVPDGSLDEKVFDVFSDRTPAARPAERRNLEWGDEVFVLDGGSRGGSLDVDGRKVPALSAFRAVGQPVDRRRATGGGKLPVVTSAELELIENIYPYSQPAIAATGSDLMVLYASDNGRTNALQATDIAWTRFDGVDWSEPADIASDTRAEFMPSVAYDGNGDAIAAWQRASDANITNANLTEMLGEMEIVWARHDSSAGTWTAPAALTTNTHADLVPLVCGPLTDGDVLMTWEENEENRMVGVGDVGDTGNSRVLWTRWDASSASWGTPAVLLSNLTYRMSESLAGHGDVAAYAWTCDMNRRVDTPEDQELFYAVWSNGVWQSVRRYETNGVADANVRLAVVPDGTIYCVWKRGSDLVMDRNFSGTPTLIRESVDGIGFADYDLTVGPAGNLVLVWQGASDPQYSVYDPVSGSWSMNTSLSEDDTLESGIAAAWDGGGNLAVAFKKTSMIVTNLTVFNEEDGTAVSVSNATVFGRVDLAVQKRTLVRDLSLTADDFTVAGETYLPGDAVELTALIRNDGDLAVSNAAVAFYNGDPDAGGTLITNVTHQAWLDGRSVAGPVQVTWIVPYPAAPHTLFAIVDPADAVAEFSETNNVQSVTIGLTDLKLTLISSKAVTGGVVRAVAEVRNWGAPASSACLLTVRKDGAPDILASVPVLALPPGRLAEIGFNLPAGTQPDGLQAYVMTLDEAGASGETNTNDNEATFSVFLNHDADGDGLPNVWEEQYGLDPDEANDAGADADGDGMSNVAEYLAGTDPQDDMSFLVVMGIGEASSDGGSVVQWGSVANRTYTVLRSTDLLESADGGFHPLAIGIPATPPVNTYIDTEATGAGPYFYRIRVD